MKEVIISKEAQGQRVDKYVRKMLNNAPLSFIYKLFRKKDVKINGRWVDISYFVKKDDVLRVYVTDEQLGEFSKPKPIEQVPFNHEIVYEDSNVLIVNKPRGLLVHGDEEEKRITLTNQVLSYLYGKGEYDPTDRGFVPAPAHRLDRNTSGLVIFGKNIASLQALLEMFKEHENLRKTYFALVKGYVSKDGKIDLPLRKNEKLGKVVVDKKSSLAKQAITLYHVMERFDDYSLLEVTILTGRTHQIRVHMQEIGHPVIGDAKYGDFAINKKFKQDFDYENQFLHAHSLKILNAKAPLEYLNGKTFIAQLGKNEKNILATLRA